MTDAQHCDATTLSTENIVKKCCLVSWMTTALIVLGSTYALGVPLWPADGAWQPISAGGGYYIDPLYAGVGTDHYATPPQPEQIDLVGGIDHHGNGPFPTAYYYSDGTDLMFRMHVDNDPTQGGPEGSQFVWTVFLNTNPDLAVEWALQLDNKVNAQVELVPAVSGGPQNAAPWNPVVLGGAPHTGVSPLSTWSRFVNATGSTARFPFAGAGGR